MKRRHSAVSLRAHVAVRDRRGRDLAKVREDMNLSRSVFAAFR
jgi:hypothetical protein